MKQSEPFSMCCGSSSVFERADVVYKYASNKCATSLGSVAARGPSSKGQMPFISTLRISVRRVWGSVAARVSLANYESRYISRNLYIYYDRFDIDFVKGRSYNISVANLFLGWVYPNRW